MVRQPLLAGLLGALSREQIRQSMPHTMADLEPQDHPELTWRHSEDGSEKNMSGVSGMSVHLYTCCRHTPTKEEEKETGKANATCLDQPQVSWAPAGEVTNLNPLLIINRAEAMH